MFFLPTKCCLLGSAFGCIFLMVFVFFWLRAESAPKPIVSKKPMEFDDFQSWFRRPRDRSGARSVSKTCSKIDFPKREKTLLFLVFDVFGLAAPRFKKMMPKCPPKPSRRASRAVLGTLREPKIDQLLASGRPGGRAKSCLGFWGASPGVPGRAQEGQGAFRTPLGGAGEAPEAILAPFWSLRETILETV